MGVLYALLSDQKSGWLHILAKPPTMPPEGGFCMARLAPRTLLQSVQG